MKDNKGKDKEKIEYSTKDLDKMTEDENLLDQLDKNFQGKTLKTSLMGMLAKQGIATLSYIATKAGLDPNNVGSALNGNKSIARNPILMMGIEAHFSVEEINELLNLSENNQLYSHIPRDRRIMYCIHQKMNLVETNLYLIKHGYEPISLNKRKSK